MQTSKAATLFAHEEHKPFHYMHCWHQLKGEPKWESICQGHSFRGLNAKSIGSSGTPSVEAQETDSGSAGLTGKCPRGRDYSKSEISARNSPLDMVISSVHFWVSCSLVFLDATHVLVSGTALYCCNASLFLA